MKKNDHHRLLFASAVTVFVLSLPKPLFAHAFGQNFSLPIPTWLFFFSGIGVVLLSFALALRSKSEVGSDGKYPSARFMIPPLAHVLLRRTMLMTASAFALAALVSAAFGPRLPSENLGSLTFWVALLIGVPFVSLLLGDVWGRIDPFRRLLMFARIGGRKEFPKGWEHVPASLLVFALFWLELVSNGWGADPRNLPTILCTYAIVTFLGVAMYGARDWYRYGDPLSSLFRMFARLSFVRYERGGVSLGMDRADDEENERIGAGYAAFVVLVLSFTMFDSLRSTELWRDAYHWSFPYFAHFGSYSGHFLMLAMFSVIPIGLFGAFYVAVSVSSEDAIAARGPSSVLGAYANAVVPLAVAYHVSHYLAMFLIDAQYLVPALSDPLGLGWDLFGGAGFVPNIGLLDVRTLWYLEVAIVLIGHVASVRSAYRVARRLDRERPEAHLPMLALAVLYTSIGLSLFVLPMA